MNPDLLILCATEPEVSVFLKNRPGTVTKLDRSGRTLISGETRHSTYDLLLTGPGVFNTAQAVTAYLAQSTPALIVQTGIAGVFKESGLDIGDPALATQERYIHTGVGTGKIETDPLPFDLIEGDEESRRGIVLFNSSLVDEIWKGLDLRLPDRKVSMAKGPFITVSSITATPKHAQDLFQVFSPLMEAMEGAASAHVASLYRVPILEIRAASNFVGERDKSGWDIPRAAKALGQVLGHLLDNVLNSKSAFLSSRES